MYSTEAKYDIIASVHGGGISGQAGAVRHGLSRALVEADPELRPALKAAGFMTRDPRMKERRKYGLKKKPVKPASSPNVKCWFSPLLFVFICFKAPALPVLF